MLSEGVCWSLVCRKYRWFARRRIKSYSLSSWRCLILGAANHGRPPDHGKKRRKIYRSLTDESVQQHCNTYIQLERNTMHKTSVMICLPDLLVAVLDPSLFLRIPYHGAIILLSNTRTIPPW